MSQIIQKTATALTAIFLCSNTAFASNFKNNVLNYCSLSLSSTATNIQLAIQAL